MDRVVGKTQERRRVKGWCVLVAVCINAQSGEQTVRPAETQFAGKSSKSRGWDVRTEMECRPVSPFVVHLASSFPGASLVFAFRIVADL